MQHTLEILSEAPGPGKQGTLHGRALPNLFFIMSLSSRTGEVVDFPNIKPGTET